MNLNELAMPATYTSGTLGYLVTGADSIRARLDRLAEQSATGMNSSDFGGLANSARLALDLQPEIRLIQTWRSNIDAAATRMQVTQAALERLTSIATEFYARSNSLDGLASNEIDTIAAMARDGLREVVGLLNTKAGEVYVFSGQDTANAPVPDGDAILNSVYYTQISTAVASLNVSGAGATLGSIFATATSNVVGVSPFTTYLSQVPSVLQSQRPFVEIGDRLREPIGILASTNAVAVSGGPNTTGSYMRDLMRVLATLGSLSSSQASDPGLALVVDDVRTALRGSITAMASDAGILGNVQKGLLQRQHTLDSIEIALTDKISAVQDADMALVLTLLSQTQTQLQSSYQIIANYRQMSLSKFLT